MKIDSLAAFVKEEKEYSAPSNSIMNKSLSTRSHPLEALFSTMYSPHFMWIKWLHKHTLELMANPRNYKVFISPPTILDFGQDLVQRKSGVCLPNYIIREAKVACVRQRCVGWGAAPPRPRGANGDGEAARGSLRGSDDDSSPTPGVK